MVFTHRSKSIRKITQGRWSTFSSAETKLKGRTGFNHCSICFAVNYEIEKKILKPFPLRVHHLWDSRFSRYVLATTLVDENKRSLICILPFFLNCQPAFVHDTNGTCVSRYWLQPTHSAHLCPEICVSRCMHHPNKLRSVQLSLRVNYPFVTLGSLGSYDGCCNENISLNGTLRWVKCFATIPC